MNYLLDTHVALWALAGSNKLPQKVIDILDDSNNNVYYSIVSVLEIAIKNVIKPEQMPMKEDDFEEYCNKVRYLKLPLKSSHIYEMKNLKKKSNTEHHKDPFDRLLLSQAIAENYILITHDNSIANYEVDNVMLI